MSNNTWFSLDCESVGLHGQTFAVGVSVVDDEGNELDHLHAHCDHRHAFGQPEDRKWVDENCPDVHPHTAHNSQEVLEQFAAFWNKWKAQGAVMVGDCAWPVEARMLARCVDAGLIEDFSGPYPLHEVATLLLAAGMDPMATYGRHHFHEPAHQPLNDARHSARLWIAARKRLASAWESAKQDPVKFWGMIWISMGKPIFNDGAIQTIDLTMRIDPENFPPKDEVAPEGKTSV